MAICNFFLRGQCKFGSFTGGGFGNSSWNRNTSTSGANRTTNAAYIFTFDGIKDDLSKEKPSWPLSSYGPAKYEPTMVAGLDMSFEELRVKAVEAQKAGNVNEYVAYEANLINAANAVYADISALGASTPSAFGSSSSVSAFGNTSTNSAFGRPSAFGAPATTSAFGAPTFGAPAPSSAFGSAPASSSASVRSETHNPPPTPQSAFGKPAFGQSTFGQSAFGQPSATPASTSAFGQPAFGQSATPTAPSTTTPSASAFGQSAGSSLIKPATGAFSAFSGGGPGGASSSTPFAAAAAANNPPPPATAGGGGAFSAFANPNPQPSAFGSAGGNSNTGGSVFGQSAFGSANPPQSAFGAGAPAATGAPQSVFGSTTTNAAPSAFGAPAAAPAAATSVFGQPQGQTQSAFGGSVFGQPQAQAQQQQPPAPSSAFSAFAASGSAFAAKPTAALAAPKKGPDFANAKYNYRPGLIPHDTKLPPNYTALLPEATLAAFKAMSFEWGKVPVWIPPVEVRVKHVAEALFS
ncbi:hypothetical protein DFP72DRAFT_870911 [Ephemerocybe angulata]|uniref:Uncharacterized protein n=1 Tax=Ephemerocybe angulata TaxID=980116 RepID=A0A8H6IFR8_9AGAR|nr:hypothetical protein DFP72DRAFT_870911 [Tulosesus angulatus]